MIRDAVVLGGVREDWAGVEALRSKLQRSAFASMSGIGGTFPFALADAAHNLPFIHACAVLNEVLLQLRDEGHFECPSRFLGVLVKASRRVLPWQQYTFIKDKVVKGRNGVAHHAALLGRGDCWKYLDAIADELCGWGILER